MNAPGGLAAALVLAALQDARPVSPPTREAQVLALVRELQERDATWYESVRFERVPAVSGNGPGFEPIVPSLCDPGIDAYWPDFVLRLEQEREGRVEAVTAPARCATLLLPAAIDLARPFTLVLELAPGWHRLAGVRLGVSARPAR